MRTVPYLWVGLWLLGAAGAHADGHGHRAMEHRHGGVPMESLGERVFQGTAGPWNVEARLIDMNAMLARSGVSAAAIAKLSARYHLMVIVTDSATGKTVGDVSGEVRIDGPDKASSSKVPLLPMGGHIGGDVRLPKEGMYRFDLSAELNGRKGSASFGYLLKP